MDGVRIPQGYPRTLSVMPSSAAPYGLVIGRKVGDVTDDVGAVDGCRLASRPSTSQHRTHSEKNEWVHDQNESRNTNR